ncbi:autotransporter outer membrane beta-barrel domain-containing protein [Luteibacter sp. NPDC031894]|uniref:autotransporter family protein n=1 Tax=Luteibacter sp. NPDC031894 TaxID=3390572 RepID=UPI003CFD03F1
MAALPPMAAADSVPIVVDGEIRTIPSGPYTFTGDSVIGLKTLNAGRAFSRNIEIDTSGKQSHAVEVTGPNSFVELVGGTLHTTGNGARGVHADGTGSGALLLHDVRIATEGAGARGALFTDASGKFRESAIETSGYNAVGIEAESGGSFSLDKSTVVTHGEAADGLLIKHGSSMEADGATIETNGRGSHGISIHGALDATATVVRTDVTTRGSLANAINANTGSGLVIITGNSRLRTEGANSVAVSVHDGAPLAVRGSLIETLARNSHGLVDRGSYVSLQDTDVVTYGYNAYGVLAQGGDIPGKTPQIDVRDSRIDTNGAFGYGAVASTGGRVTLIDSTVTTTGDNAHGMLVTAADLATRGSAVSTTGKGAYGAIIQGGGNLSIDGGSLSSAQAAALGLHDPGTIRIGGGAVLRGGDGAFAEVDPASTKAFTLTIEDKAVAIGDIRLSQTAVEQPDETRLSLSALAGATWSGASSIVRDLSLASGGTWVVTGDSHVGSLRNDHGVVAFAPATAATFGTLTIAGDYEGNEGLFRMRTRLGDDSSPSDRIHVMGNTSGTSFIAVDALDGRGDHTVDGVRLVRVDGRSDGRFALSGRAVAGAHEYFLHQGSLSEPSDGGWYLRSSLPPDPILDPEEGKDPIEPIDPVDPPVPPPVLRPETGTYRANQVAALDMFQAGPGAGRDDEPDSSRGRPWARFERRHTAFDLGRQVTTTTATNELTIGTDLLQGDGAMETHVGVMAALGNADTRGTSLLTRYSARGRVKGAAGGIYGGLRTAAGTYLRGWAQYAHFNQRVEGTALASERYGSGTLTTSVEAGHRWRKVLNRDTDIYLEPQAQITATRLRGGAHTEANGTRVNPLHASGSTARAGMRAAARWQTPGGHVASPYLTASWLRRLGRLDATQFDGQPFAGGVPRNAYALKLGLSMLRNDGWRLWGDVETRFGVHRYRRVAGTLGVRKTW